MCFRLINSQRMWRFVCVSVPFSIRVSFPAVVCLYFLMVNVSMFIQMLNLCKKDINVVMLKPSATR